MRPLWGTKIKWVVQEEADWKEERRMASISLQHQEKEPSKVIYVLREWVCVHTESLRELLLVVVVVIVASYRRVITHYHTHITIHHWAKQHQELVSEWSRSCIMPQSRCPSAVQACGHGQHTVHKWQRICSEPLPLSAFIRHHHHQQKLFSPLHWTVGGDDDDWGDCDGDDRLRNESERVGKYKHTVLQWLKCDALDGRSQRKKSGRLLLERESV